MAKKTHTFYKDSDNQLIFNLTEDEVVISGAITQIDIIIGPVTISRTTPNIDTDGITYANGVATINPADLTEDLSALIAGAQHRMYIVIYDAAANNDGAVFGGDDDKDKWFINIADKPT